MIDLLYQGGIVMIPIVLCSILALSFTVERVIYLWKREVAADIFWEDVGEALDQGNFPKVLEGVKLFDGSLADVVRRGLSVEPLTHTRASEAMEEFGLEEVNRLERFLPAMDFIGRVSPLLGLLGTVAGMIETFSVIADAGVGRPEMLAGGISQALVTTAAGLTVGIVTLFFHHLISRWVDRIIHEMEMGVRRVESALKETGREDSDDV